MAPIKVLNLLLTKIDKLGIDISLLPLLVVRNHPEKEEYREEECGRRRCEVETVTDMVYRHRIVSDDSHAG